MTLPTTNQVRQTATGTLQVFAAEALGLATGLLTAAFLTRQLGPELYGLFTVAATIVVWIEVSTILVLSRTTVKFVAEATDWKAVASTLARAQLLLGLGSAALLVVVAPALAAWLKSAELSIYLRLFALDIPIFTLAHIHRSILAGRGAFGRRAILTAGRWLSRMVLIFLLVGLGLSVTGAILASIGTSVVELIVARVFVRPALLGRSALPIRHLGGYALPLFFCAVGMHLFNRLDLLVVKALSGAPEAAGFYGAAQNLTIVPGLFAASFSPPLLATMTQLLGQGQDKTARAMARQAMRLVLCLLPFAGVAAGAASEIVGLIYGRPFLPTGPLVALLIFSALALTMISVTTTILTAAGRPGLTFALTGPLVPLALGAHLLLVPRFGPPGAAAATTALAWLGAGTTTLAVYRQCAITPAPATILRTTLTALIAYFLSSAWHTSGAWLVVKLAGITAVILTCLFLLGELTGQDLAFARSLLRREQVRPPALSEQEL
ncbi:MAG: oligosaccharide flippase family protein [Anaerolineae bacterium]|nr:oligosaccharide flippase family protein [Anaerolineae bacterium]